jgi:hypothetical protein
LGFGRQDITGAHRVHDQQESLSSGFRSAPRVARRGCGRRGRRGPRSLKTGWLVAVEVGIVTSEEEAFESFRLNQYFARDLLSFDPKIIDEPINAPNNVAMYHAVVPGPFDIASGGFGEQPEFLDRVLSSIPGERPFKLAVPVGH